MLSPNIFGENTTNSNAIIPTCHFLLILVANNPVKIINKIPNEALKKWRKFKIGMDGNNLWKPSVINSKKPPYNSTWEYWSPFAE